MINKIFEDEIYKECYCNNKYLVSNYGNIYNLQLQICPNIYTHKSGYSVVSIDGVKQWVHRLVAYTFIYPDQHYGELVNHKNGIKNDNRVSNLEWCTNSMNIKHFYENSIPKEKTTYTLEQKHLICSLLEQGFSSKQIAENIGINCDINFVKMLSKVRTGYRWEDISKNYNISKNIHSEEYINKICSLLEHGYKAKDVSIILNIPLDNNLNTLVSDIINKKRWKSISDNYNISKPTHSKDEVEMICKMITKGYTSKQIALELGINYDKKFITLISFIKTKRSWTNISSKYNI